MYRESERARARERERERGGERERERETQPAERFTGNSMLRSMVLTVDTKINEISDKAHRAG